jgi:hypothetical protein
MEREFRTVRGKQEGPFGCLLYLVEIQRYLSPSSSPPSVHSPISRTFLMTFCRIFEILRIDHQYPEVRFQVDTIPNLSGRQSK